MFDMYTSMQTNITSLAEKDNRCEWYENRKRGRFISLRRRQKTRRDNEKDEVGLECNQMEVTIEGTQSRTQASGRSLCLEFSSAVRDMPAHVFGGGETNKGWIQSKRRRGSTTKRVGCECTKTLAPCMSSHSSLNLNLSLDKLAKGGSMRGRGLNAVSSSRGGGRASGRGTCRVKRPLPVQPRYGSTASFPAMTPTVVNEHNLYVFNLFSIMCDWIGMGEILDVLCA